MAVTDPAIDPWMRTQFAYVNDKPVLATVSLELICGVIGAAFVVAVGMWIARRKAPAPAAPAPAREPASER